MKILIDIGHPAHIHYFKNFIKIMEKKGHKFLIIARDRGIIQDLLQKYKFDFVDRGKGNNSLFGKFIYMFSADYKIFVDARKFKPDLFLSFSSPYAAQVSFLLRKPHVALTDTEHEDNVLSKFTYPFSTTILTPSSYQNNLGNKHLKFNSVVENLYLDKKYFNPDIRIRKDLKLNKNSEFVIIRFVSWNAHHDVGHVGLNYESKKELIEILKHKFKIFISSEGKLPKEFKQYEINVSPEKIHDVLAEASIFIGESATMASESTLLGTQAVYINSLPLMGYLEYEQNSGLLKHFNSSKGVVKYVSELIKDDNLKKSAIKKSKIMQKDFINPTKFLVWFIENYPNSERIIKENPEYQLKFK